MNDDHRRTDQYAKNHDYEALVRRLNHAIGNRERAQRVAVERPIVFITGLPRSGTTLLYQVLAATDLFAYPSNFISRFYARPALGLQVQRLARAWLAPGPMSFASQYGNTRHWYEPHEFGYFWQRHFPFAEHHQPDWGALKNVNIAELSRDFAEMQAESGKPLLFKNVILDFVNSFMAENFPASQFIHIKWPTLHVAQSLLQARVEYYGTLQAWFSVRPKDVNDFADRGAAVQVAHQISEVQKALTSTQSLVGPQRWFELEYRQLCSRPHEWLKKIAQFAHQDLDAEVLMSIPTSFDCRDEIDLPAEQMQELRAALADAAVV